MTRSSKGRPSSRSATRFGLRPYDSPEPLTELHYRTSNTGLQSIYALHTQRHRLKLFGQGGVMRVLFGYGGHGSKGEYDGSRLRRMRQLLLRMRYERRDWSVAVVYFYNQRQLGAHGGVEPAAGLSFESVYNRFGASGGDCDSP